MGEADAAVVQFPLIQRAPLLTFQSGEIRTNNLCLTLAESLHYSGVDSHLSLRMEASIATMISLENYFVISTVVLGPKQAQNVK